MSTNGNEDSHANSMRRLENMESVIRSMIDLAHEQLKVSAQQHQDAMEELRELRELQKEQRIDIMAPFAGNKDLRETFQRYLERKER